MKTSVKYGIYTSIAVIALKLIMALCNLEVRFAYAELGGIFLILIAGLIGSIRATQQTDYNGAATATELLKEGLITSAVFSLSFSVFSLIVKFVQHDLPPSVAQLIFGLVFFFIFMLIVGGLVSVFISYAISKKKSG